MNAIREDKPYIVWVDERLMLDIFEEELNLKYSSEYNIKFAKNGNEALLLYKDLIRSNMEIPLVICDYSIPDIKGDEVLKAINSYGTDTVKVLAAGQANMKGIKNAINDARIFKYIEKPYDTDSLFAKIDECLNFYNKKKFALKKNEELKQQNSDLENVFKIKSDTTEDFTYRVTNEVKESLIAVKNGMEVLQNLKGKLEDTRSEVVKESIQKFEEQFSSISTLINHLANTIDIYTNNKKLHQHTDEIDEMLIKATNIRSGIIDSIEQIFSRLNEIEKLMKRNPLKIATWDDEEIFLFNPDEIMFFSSEGRSIVAITKTGKYKVKDTISSLEEKLSEHNFFRCHKSYLVNLKYVNKITPWLGYDSYMSKIDGCDLEVPISRNYIKDMKKMLGI